MTKPLTLQLAKSIAWKRNKDVRGELLLLSLFLYTFQNLPSSKIGRLGCTWRKYSRTMMSSVDLIGMCKQPLTSSVLASSGDMTDNSSNCRKLKKRLWWCCVLRDRILPLGVRRPLQITHNHLNSAGQELTEEDLEEEIGKSEVYDTETQHLLVKLLLAQCKLAVELTDVITMVYPADGANLVTMACEDDFNRVSIETKGYEMKLTDWYNAIDQWIPTVLGKSHASITLFASLLYIYYQYVQSSHFVKPTDVSDQM